MRVTWTDEAPSSGAGSALEAMDAPDGAWRAPFIQQPRYIGSPVLRGEQPSHCPTIRPWMPATRRDPTRDRYAQVNAPGDTLTPAPRCPGRHETPC